jgi:F0F1-type ATP synthase epsilon subunit
MVTLPSAVGQIGVYPQHTPLMTQMVPGEIIVHRNGGDLFIASGEGLIEVTADRVAVLTDLAVAAASILARNEFVTRLANLEKQYGMAFPKGASAAVDAAAKEFVTKFGADNLRKVAKMHFRTALRAQGLPEPPKVEWRKRG